MAKKIDLTRAKDFLFNHGEKVALGTCVFLSLFFGGMGLLSAVKAGRSPETGRPWTQEFSDRHPAIQKGINDNPVPTLPLATEDMLKANHYLWTAFKSDYASQPYMNVGETEDKKRQNPAPFAVKSGPKNFQLDYVPGLFLTHELTTVGGQPAVKWFDAAGAGPAMPQPGGKKNAIPGAPIDLADMVKAGDPRRIVVGHAVFPMKDQMLEFQRALKMPSQKEMLEVQKDDLPRILGINVVREEILPGGKKSEPEVLVNRDPVTGKIVVADRLKKFLSVAIYDDKNPALLEPYIWEGATMPLPRLAYGSYPRVNLPGIEMADNEEGVAQDPGMPAPTRKGSGIAMPGGKGPPRPMMKDDPKMAGSPDRTIRSVTRKQLEEANADLERRLFNKDFNIFHVLGLPVPPKDEVKTNQPGMPRGPGLVAQADKYFTAWSVKSADEATGPGGAGPQKVMPKPPVPGVPDATAAFAPWSRDALVRFIDVDVVPGKTYRYGIQVRIANPNFGKSKEVAYAQLASFEEFGSEFVYTEAITIPHEYFLYALDQHLLDDFATGSKVDPKMKDTTIFQIHQWIKTGGDQKVYVIGDWAVAERVIVRKGGIIGQEADVLVPLWKDTKDAFELPHRDKRTGRPAPIKLDLLPTAADNVGSSAGEVQPPVLVDFTGGRRKLTALIDEECAVDALILAPNGKLRVLNSRDAVDAATESAKLRQDRLIHARQRVAEIQGTGQTPKGSGGPKGPALPGVGNN